MTEPTDISLAEGLHALQSRSKAAASAIYAYIALSAIAVVTTFAGMAGVLEYSDPAKSGPLSISAGLALPAFWIVQLASMVVICRWIYRAHANLFTAGIRNLKFSPAWAVGWYFIPIANLFVPLQAMRELLRASCSTSDGEFRDPPELMPWWILFAVVNVAGSSNSFFAPDQFKSLMSLIALVMDMISAWCLLQLIKQVTRSQTERLPLNHTFA